MRQKTWFEKTLHAVRDSLEYRLEGIILNLTEQICQKMKDKRLTRTQLAEKLQVSPAAVTKILNGKSNFTLKTLLTIGEALNVDLAVNFRPREMPVEARHLFKTCTAYEQAVIDTVICPAGSIISSTSAESGTRLNLFEHRQEDEYKRAVAA